MFLFSCAILTYKVCQHFLLYSLVTLPCSIGVLIEPYCKIIHERIRRILNPVLLLILS